MDSKKASVNQENEIAKLLDGRTQSNSGGTRFGGGDIQTNDFLIEAKTPTTSKKSFSIKKKWLDKAKEQAFEQGKSYSALAFRFDPQDDDYFVIDSTLFKMLVNQIEK